MYSFQSRVRYSELDSEGKLSIKSMMDYLQDCSTFQSESIGLGIEYLKANNRAWWLSSWNIDILSLPRLGDEIIISTNAYGFKGIYGYRNFSIKDREGNYLIKADSTWFFFDTKNMIPARPKDEEVAPYLGKEERLEMTENLDKKIKHIEGGKYLPYILVGKHHLDTNKHVNNAVYIDMAKDLIDSKQKLANISVIYKKMALLNDKIYPYIVDLEDRIIVELNDENNNIFSYISMRKLEE